MSNKWDTQTFSYLASYPISPNQEVTFNLELRAQLTILNSNLNFLILLILVNLMAFVSMVEVDVLAMCLQFREKQVVQDVLREVIGISIGELLLIRL